MSRAPAPGTVIWSRYTSTHAAISATVTGVPEPVIRAPTAVRAGRTVALPSLTHSGHWNPTEAGRMSSGQIGRPQRWQEIQVSRSGWR